MLGYDPRNLAHILLAQAQKPFDLICTIVWVKRVWEAWRTCPIRKVLYSRISSGVKVGDGTMSASPYLGT